MAFFQLETMNKPIRIKVLIADAHGLFARNTVALLSGDSRIIPVGIAKNRKECLDSLSQSEPDVILLNIRFPGAKEIELAEQIKTARPEIKIIVITEFEQDDHGLASIRKAAEGLLPKDCPISEMITIILKVAEGNTFYSPSLLFFSNMPMDFADLHIPAKPVEVLKRILNAEEKEIMGFVAKGLQNKEIALALGLSVRAVDEKIKIILLKFGVGTRLEAALSWAEIGD